jgi:hypothetical protein
MKKIITVMLARDAPNNPDLPLTNAEITKQAPVTIDVGNSRIFKLASLVIWMLS